MTFGNNLTYLTGVILLLILLPSLCLAADKNEQLNAALLNAAYANKFEKVARLLARGADANYKDRSGSSALSWSVINGNLKLVKYLIKHGADIQHTGKDRINLLHLAVTPQISPPLKANQKWTGTGMAQRYAMLEYLLQKQLDPNSADESGTLPIHYAVSLGGDTDKLIKIIALLISHGSPIDQKNQYGFTPMDLATNPAVKAYLKSKMP